VSVITWSDSKLAHGLANHECDSHTHKILNGLDTLFQINNRKMVSVDHVLKLIKNTDLVVSNIQVKKATGSRARANFIIWMPGVSDTFNGFFCVNLQLIKAQLHRKFAGFAVTQHALARMMHRVTHRSEPAINLYIFYEHAKACVEYLAQLAELSPEALEKKVREGATIVSYTKLRLPKDESTEKALFHKIIWEFQQQIWGPSLCAKTVVSEVTFIREDFKLLQGVDGADIVVTDKIVHQADFSAS